VTNYSPIILPQLTRIEIDGKRFYTTPEGNNYPSVTSVLSVGDSSWLDEWVAKVGEKEAQIISNRAANRGTVIHSLIENYLKTGFPQTPSIFDREIWNSLLPLLERIGKISSLEGYLYSDRLQVAGSVDCVAEFDNHLSIIDFKTSKRNKQKEDIHSYFMQTAAYAYMWFERTGEIPSKLVILMAIDHEKPKVFIEPAKDWLLQFIEKRKYFRQLYGV
jgi:CRISPR/Cas system-associated exonuclease Cas4 (RecB family)